MKMPRELVSEDAAKERLLLAVFGPSLERPGRFVPFVDGVLATLTEREQSVLRKRFSGMSLAEVAKETPSVYGDGGVTRERVRQIEAKALRKLRHPTRAMQLKGKFKPLVFSRVRAKNKDMEKFLLEDVEFSFRTNRCLSEAGIVTVGELIKKTERDLLAIDGFGRKSLNEVKEILSEIGLQLMVVGGVMNADRLAELCKDEVDLTGKCQDCDCEVKVTIKRTDEGFLVTGGAVYEPTRDKFYLKCDECFEREPVLKNFQPVECYSRIVGYLRPISQWNDGKLAEFNNRKTFDVGKALAQ